MKQPHRQNFVIEKASKQLESKTFPWISQIQIEHATVQICTQNEFFHIIGFSAKN